MRQCATISLENLESFVIWLLSRLSSGNLTPKLLEWTLLYETLGTKPSLSRVWNVVKILLVLSHGQASVERGFSINKELIVENQRERSLVAQRLIVDHVRSVGGVTKVEIKGAAPFCCRSQAEVPWVPG